jgi:hypothetical protein
VEAEAIRQENQFKVAVDAVIYSVGWNGLQALMKWHRVSDEVIEYHCAP